MGKQVVNFDLSNNRVESIYFSCRNKNVTSLKEIRKGHAQPVAGREFYAK